jgi:arabinofuranosyltransferase
MLRVRKPIWILLVLLAGLLACELFLGRCVQEDAFISFRYARNLVTGHGLVYNPGQRVEGYTNFLWTLYLAGGLKLGLDPVPLSRFTGLLASLALVVVVFRLGRSRDAPRRISGGLLAAVLVVATPGVAGEAVQGLETIPFALLVTGGVGLAAEAWRREVAGGPGAACRHFAAGGLLALAALTRPEGLGVFGLALLGGAVWRLRQRLGPLSRAGVGSVLLFLLVYGSYWLWRFTYYGYPFPNTFYAKTGGGIWQALRGLNYLGHFLLLHPAITLLSGWALVGGLRERGAAALRPATGAPGGATSSPFQALAGAVVVGYLLYVVAVGGDFKKTSRFILPVLPLWALLLDDVVSRRGWPSWPGLKRSAAAVARPGGDRTGGAGQPWAAGPRAWALLAAVMLSGLVATPSAVRWARWRAWDLVRRTECGRYLAVHARPGAVLAIHSAGIIPYYSGLHTIDMWGLNDLHIGHRRMTDMGRDRLAGHEKSDPAYVFSLRPDYYVDEFYYLMGEPIRDLKERFSPPQDLVDGMAELYRVRNVPLWLDDGRGHNRYWFNFLELALSDPAGSVAIPDP